MTAEAPKPRAPHAPAGAAAVCLLALGTLCLQGCATGPTFVENTDVPSDKGLVYIYRPVNLLTCAVVVPVTAGGPQAPSGKTVARLHCGGYCPYVVAPGEVEFVVAGEATTAITIDVRPRKVHYVKETVDVGFFTGQAHLTQVTTEVGAAEIRKCRKEKP